MLGVYRRQLGAAYIRIEISAGAVSGCGFSLSDLKEGRDCRPKGMRTGEFIFLGNG